MKQQQQSNITLMILIMAVLLFSLVAVCNAAHNSSRAYQGLVKLLSYQVAEENVSTVNLTNREIASLRNE